jgi:RNA polymerase subunit RPABC4/transcription elongation factor Spt4
MDDPDLAKPSLQHFFTKQLIESSRPLRWSWPLQVDLFREDTAYVDYLMSGHWTHEFAEISLKDSIHKEGILFIPEGWDHYVKTIEENWHLGQHFGVTLILESPSFFATEQPDPSLSQKIIEMIQQTDASGIFIVHNDRDVAVWFNYVFENLSHNLNIVEVLERSTVCGYFFYDQKLETETKLSSVIEGIEKGLSMANYASEEEMYIRSRITGQRNFKGSELSEFFRDNAPHFRFDHESGEASGLKEITSVLYPKFGKEIFITHVKNYMHLMAPPLEESEPPSPSTEISTEDSNDATRYLQAKIVRKDIDDKTNLLFLRPNTDYEACIKIAVLDSNFVSSFTPVNTDLVFEKSVQNEEELTIRFVTGENEPIQTKTLPLPRQGDSEERVFTLTTKGRTGTFIATIFIYHGQRLIQIGQLQSHIVPEGDSTSVPGTTMTTLFSALSDQESLDAGKKYANSFHVLQDEHGLQLLESNTAKETVLRSNDGLKKLVSKIKIEIETAARKTEEYPEDLTAQNNVDLLRRLALKGNDLFVNYILQQESEGPVQIVAYQQEFVPLDFVYTLPAPSLTAGLCDHAIEALKEGACKNCHHFAQTPADHICPFGFWGLRRVIERFRYDGEAITNNGDFAFVTGGGLPRPVLPILQHVIHASTAKTEALSQGLRDTVFETIEKYAPASHWSKSWKDWGDRIREKEYPESLLLIVHTEVNEVADVMQIEIEKEDFLLKNYLTKDHITVSEKIKPFVVVLGCSTADLQEQGFDISSQFLNNGAAIVVSNFTKIRGSQAGKIMIRLIELLKATTQKEATLGEVMLKLRQQMLAEGLMVSLSVITHGDANWKLKS